jgi:hypothetical protein
VVGFEGLWGVLVYAILLPIFQHINCSGSLCPSGILEDTKAVFDSWKYDNIIWLQSIGVICSISCFNATGVAVTKYASAAQRSTVDTCRTLIIWLASLIIGWESFYWQELLGFFLLVGGTLCYNEIVILPCGFLNYNTKKMIASREHKPDLFGEGKDPNFMSTSPHAYDANRNRRNLQEKFEERDKLISGHE